MKKLKIIYYLFAVSLLAGCGTDDEGTTTTPDAGNIIADFTFTGDKSYFEFTNLSEGASEYRWDFGDLSFYCDKESPTYVYSRAGGDLQVTLTAMNDSGNEASVTKTITAPEVKNIDIAIDGDFSDWDAVDVLVDDSATGDGSMQILKVWGGGDNLNIYIEGNTSMLLELMSLYINTDNNSSIGYEAWQWGADSGIDFLFQGPIGPLWWGDTFNSSYTDGNSSVWDADAWNWVGGIEGYVSSNIINVDADTNAIEFSVSKSILGGNNIPSSMTLGIAEMTSGWSEIAWIPQSGWDKALVSYEFPVESSGQCE